MALLVVLPDGKTFAPIEGCKIISIPNDFPDDDEKVKSFVEYQYPEGVEVESLIPEEH